VPSIHSPIPAIPTLHDDGIIGNPVGQLQELTQKKKWSPPMYEFAQEQGTGHPREFVCVVKLGKKFKEAGKISSATRIFHIH
jgi:dsRNA-specific ribonuclease